jgi:hypothetical protein
MKLNPEELVVDTFDTSTEGNYEVLRPITDPTPDSRCFVCPVYSEDCY